ncbi:MAG: 30S ribosomal protein S6 [Clostridia bacterium]|nr:30S ribosomal protein S6 [Clostridia bacterium]
MNKYELIYILDASLEEPVRRDLIDKFSQLITGGGGEIEKIDEWGKRRLAYAIDYKTEGFYVLIVFKADPDLPREIERNLEINENVIRYLVVKLITKNAGVKPRPVRHAPQIAVPVPENDAAQPIAVEVNTDSESAAEPTPEAEVPAVQEAVPGTAHEAVEEPAAVSEDSIEPVVETDIAEEAPEPSDMASDDEASPNVTSAAETAE